MLNLKNILTGSLGLAAVFLAIGFNTSDVAAQNVKKTSFYPKMGQPPIRHRFGYFTRPGDPLPTNYRGSWSHRENASARDFTGCRKSHTDSGTIPISPGMNLTKVLTANCPHANSQAEALVTLNNYGPTLALRGMIEVKGFAKLDVPKGKSAASNARSASSISFQGGYLKRGRWTWSPSWGTSVSGGEGVVNDPISFLVTDPTTGNILLDTTILDINAKVEEDGEIAWDDAGIVTLSGLTNGLFNIDISSPYTTQQGILDIVVKDGLFTSADDSGIFDGILPLGLVGSNSIPLTLDLTSIFPDGDIVLDYDLGFDNQDVDIEATLSGSGSAAVSVPEPSSLAGMLIVASFAVNLAINRRR